MAGQRYEEPRTPSLSENFHQQPPSPADNHQRDFQESSTNLTQTGNDGGSEQLQFRLPYDDNQFPHDLDFHGSSAEGVPFIGPPRNASMDSELDTSVGDVSLVRRPVPTSIASPSLDSKTREPIAWEVSSQTSIPWVSKPLWKIWWLEILYILLSVLMFVAIVAVLASYDQHSLPDWPLKITLNTLISFLTTLAKASFMIPVSIAISQSQWTWFLRERPLSDFDIFNQASRGSWGSLILIWRVRFRHFIALGALLMVVSLVTTPVTQLAINYPVRSVVVTGEESNAFAIKTIRSPKDQLDLGTRKALMMATVADSSVYLRPIDLLGSSCTTGNCTFDTYQSLGVCMKMANITSHLKIEEFENQEPGDMPLLGDDKGSSIIPGKKVSKASLPGGYDMAHQGSMTVLTDMLKGRETFGFTNATGLVQARIASFVVMYTTPVVPSDIWDSSSGDELEVAEVMADVEDFRHEALEVLFHLCVQSFDTVVHKGVEETRQTSELTKPIGLETASFLDMDCSSIVHDANLACNNKPSRWDDIIHLESPVKGSKSPNASDGEAGFSANYHSMEMMASALMGSLPGYARAQYDPKLYPDADIFTGGREFIKSLFQDVLFELNNVANHTSRYIAVTNLYTNVATSMSFMIRVGQPQKFTHSGFNVTGRAWQEASYVNVTWGWISFLAIEIVLAGVFLAATIIAQSRSGSGDFAAEKSRPTPRDMKDSSLATLVALGGECRAAVGEGLQPMGELRGVARRMRVRLEGNEIVPVGDME